MAKYTRQDILELIDEEDIEFIRLQFTDIFGVLKNVAICSVLSYNSNQMRKKE